MLELLVRDYIETVVRKIEHSINVWRAYTPPTEPITVTYLYAGYRVTATVVITPEEKTT